MHRILIFILSLFIFVTQNITATEMLAKLVSSESDPDSFIENCVNVINGDYCEAVTDLVVTGPDTLMLQRYYNSGNYVTGKKGSGWRIYPQRFLVVGKSPNGKSCTIGSDTFHWNLAFTGERSGGILLYQGWRKSDGSTKDPLKIDIFENCRGIVNTYAKELSARFNHQNNLLNIKPDSCEVLLGDGTKRLYKKADKLPTRLLGEELILSFTELVESPDFFLLDQETLPSGNHLLFTYDVEGHLTSLELKNQTKTKTLSWIQFEYRFDGVDSFVKISTSDNKSVAYHFANDLVDVEGSQTCHCVYEYQNSYLTKKNLPEGRSVSIEYDHTGRVVTLSKPNALTRTPERVYSFFYGDSYTDVEISNGIKTRYYFNKRNELTAVEKYTPDQKLFRRDRKFWGKTKKDAGLLLAKMIEDGSSRIQSYHAYKYDTRGNATEEKLYGNLTGKSEANLCIDDDGKLINGDAEECNVKTYEYSQDGFNVLTQLGDAKGNKILLFYKPGTNLLTRKYIYDKSTIKKRLFTTYDENGVAIKIAEDDGSELDENKVAGYGVTERHITIIKPKDNFPGLGSAEVVEEKGLDLYTRKEFLVKKIINDFDSQGNNIASHTYDSNDVFAYSIKNTFNKLGQKVSTTDPIGKEHHYTYDGLGNKIMETIPYENKSITYEYDFRNQLTEVKETLPDVELVVKYFYDDLGRKIATIDHFGNTTHFEYDPFGRVSKITHPEALNEYGKVIQPVFSYTYDIFGNATSIVDACGYITYKTYNLRGDVTKISYPDGTCEIFKYDCEGSLHRSLTRDQIVTVYEYDYLGRCIYEEVSSLKPNNTLGYLNGRSRKYNGFRCTYESEGEHVQTLRYDSVGRLVGKIEMSKYDSETSSNARVKEFSYDALGRVSQQKNWFDVGPKDYTVTHFTRDTLGNVLEKKVVDAQGITLVHHSYIYDCSNRLTEEYTYANGTPQLQSKTTYNSQGQPIVFIDATGNECTVQFDNAYQNDLNQKVLRTVVTNLFHITTEIEYDALSRLISICKKDADGILLQSQKTLYDPLGNKAIELHQNISDGKEIGSKTIRSIYGPMGRLEEEIEAFGSPEEKKTIYTYNQYGQLASKAVQGTASPLFYFYNEAGLVSRVESKVGKDQQVLHSYFYDRDGNISIANSQNGTMVERAYNAFHQPIRETISDGEGKYTMEYTYDRKGRLKNLTLPDKSKIAYLYDGLFGRQVKRLSPNGEVLYSHTYDTYDQHGRLLSETLIGYLGKQEHVYDSAGRKVALNNDYTHESATYDILNRVTEITKDNQRTRFTYDSLSQLTSVQAKETKSYSYTSLGERIVVSKDEHTFSSLNQLVSSPKMSFSYDPQGNLLRKVIDGEETKLEFSPLSHLLTVKKADDSSCSFIYDAFGRLLTKKKYISKDKQTKLIATTRYLNLGFQEIGTLNKNGGVESLKVPGLASDGLSLSSIAFEIAGETYAPLHTISGHISALLDPLNREIQESYSYTAFGEESIYNSTGELLKTSALANPWRFAEKRHDPDTGLIAFGFRYYDPSMAQWISQDPLGFYDGPNAYTYLHNNPLQFIDRFGLAAEPNVTEANLKYFYGEVEDHCHCEKHRSCKRGGDIGKNDSPSLPKITYDDDFENRMARINPRALRSSVYDLSGEGLPELSADMQIGFINGIDNTFEEAKESARYLSKLAGGYNIHAVYNATHGKYYDLQECLMGLNYIATEPVRQLHRMWNSFFEKSAHGKFLMICHSQGAIHVRNALLDYPQELRERIHVVAIAPGGYIYKLTCAQLIHYRAEACRDFIPRIDRTGALREQELIIDLQSHPDANFFDHSINSPTYSDEIINRIQNYIKSNRAM